MDITLRKSQQPILDYTGGRLGISAVPGAGKTYVLSALAADLIGRGALGRDQEILIVTLVNSAVDNFSHRIGAFIQAQGLIPHLSYRVRTLHGLAHDIVREKPATVGLEERFGIIDEREADAIRREAVRAFLQANPDHLFGHYIRADLDDYQLNKVRREGLPGLVEGLALAFIRSAKDRRLTPEALAAKLTGSPGPLPLAEMGLAIYTDYQRALAYRGAVDFDDLIRLALDLLERDDEYLERLRQRYPFILEDEAQDSSLLQEQILRLLSGPEGNWVRVGDPNQAIFETFTTSNPRYLRQFIKEEAENAHDLPESGRSQPAIIALANHMIDWVMSDHPEPQVRDALSPPYIHPAPAKDPQKNPPDDPAAIHFIGQRLTPEQEVEVVVGSVTRLLDSLHDLPSEKQPTIAILVPRNQRGVEVIDALKKQGLDPVEFLASTSTTRAAAGSLAHLIAYLADPSASSKLARAYRVWRRDWREDSERLKLSQQVSELLHKIRRVEEYLSPEVESEGWLAQLEATLSTQVEADLAEALRAELGTFREVARRWLAAVSLPIDQLVLSLAGDIFSEPADLALAHKLALVLRRTADDHAEWRLPELTAELAVIARNERRFIGFSSDDSGFDPERHRGRVVVTTMHKAKGLEWDRVYLVSVTGYDFPSNQPNDRYISEKWFVRDHLNLEAEALAQLKAALATDEYDWYSEGRASLAARLDYVRERLRLLYVGITRAKRDLIVTWNTGRTGDQAPALPFAALQGWLEANPER
ncbi:MAG: ATP-dependent helicase [Anaerolineales bacterium]|nr:ATP-dependent helicase [Anaerolineales bacterium]